MPGDVHAGIGIEAPKNSICCCFGLRMGLKLASLTMLFASLIGVVQVFGMFALYRNGTPDSSGSSGWIPADAYTIESATSENLEAAKIVPIEQTKRSEISGEGGIYQDYLSKNMTADGPDLCLFIMLIIRCIEVFGGSMTLKFVMGHDNDASRQNVSTGFLVMIITQWICGIASFVAISSAFSLQAKYNFGLLGPGQILPFFFHEILLLYFWIKARKYQDIADNAKDAGFNFENAKREFELV